MSRTTISLHPVKNKTIYKGLAIFVIGVILVTFSSAFTYLQSDRSSVTNTFANQSQSHCNSFSSALDNHASRRLLQEEEDDDKQCQEVNNVHDDQKCDFVRRTKSCHQKDNFFDYNGFVYCRMKNVRWLAAIILVLIVFWLFAFTGLAVCTDNYFCPALVVISTTLRLSPNVAGVTFLAFGNGAADLFSAFAAFSNIKPGQAGLGLGGLFGAGIFVSTFIVGSISILKPFRAMQRPFLRDCIFYMVAVYWTFFILYSGKFFLAEAIVYVLMYVFYVIVVIISGAVYKRIYGHNPDQTGIAGDGENSGCTELTTYTAVKEKKAEATPIPEKRGYSVGLRRQGSLDDFLDTKPKQETAQPTLNGTVSYAILAEATKTEVKPPADYGPWEEKPPVVRTPLQTFLRRLIPIDLKEWPHMPIYAKIFEVWKSPIVFVIRLTCPVIVYEEDMWNWNRYLQCVQLAVGPPVVVLLIKYGHRLVNGVMPVAVILLLCGLALALLVFFTSRNDKKPVYVEAFGYLAFVIAIIWIYVISNEVVALLRSFGVIFNVSQSILGLTLLAWGNSVGDWIANVVMARQGFPRMAFSACFGAPFFNLSVGFGLPLILNMTSNGQSYAVLLMNPVQLVMVIFLIGSCVVNLICVPLMRFRLTKYYGFALFIFYIAFLVIALLAETKVILSGWKPDRPAD